MFSFYQTKLLGATAHGESSIKALDAKMGRLESGQRQGLTLSSNIRSELRAVSREVAKSKQLNLDVPHFGRSILFIQDTDERLRLQPAVVGAENLSGQLEGFGEVECCKMMDENSAAGSEVPRLVNIYSRMSSRTVCRKLWGILERSEGKYAVMESLRESSTLESALGSGDFLTKVNLVQRLHLAWEISNAVDYLHSVNILLKSLSSLNVYIFGIESEDRTIRPVLTDLENARLVSGKLICFLHV
jgi:serine/threonine protein kinase